jgi:hypothetical protein
MALPEQLMVLAQPVLVQAQQEFLMLHCLPEWLLADEEQLRLC